MKRFTLEGQDPVIVEQAHARAAQILTAGETLEYVAVANRGSLKHAPDCAVATSKRIILYRKKVLGKLEQDDFHWRDVRNAALKDARGGVTFTLESIQGWQMAIESLPKPQAWRLYEIAVENSPKLAESLLKSTGPIDPGLVLSEVPPLPPTSIEPMPPANVPQPAAPPVPAQPPLSALPSVPAAAAYSEPPASAPAPEPVQQHPTPESVLQAILQQAVREAGAPTRPMTLSAAAFQAPVADAQPVTFSETTTDYNMRSMPRLNSLEEISVFSGPLTGGLASGHLSGSLNAHEPGTLQGTNGTGAKTGNGTGQSADDDYAQLARSYGPPEPQAQSASAGPSTAEYNAAYQDEDLPLPGSNSSGPLLEAAYEGAAPVYHPDLVSGSLETQSLDGQVAGGIADRITSTHLNGRTNGHAEPAVRPQRYSGYTRPGGVPAAKDRQPVAPAPRAEADDPVQKMKQLKAMLDAGLIEQADYEAKKADILSRL